MLPKGLVALIYAQLCMDDLGVNPAGSVRHRYRAVATLSANVTGSQAGLAGCCCLSIFV